MREVVVRTFDKEDWADITRIMKMKGLGDGRPSDEVYGGYLDAVSDGAYDNSAVSSEEVDEDLLVDMIRDTFDLDCDAAIEVIDDYVQGLELM